MIYKNFYNILVSYPGLVPLRRDLYSTIPQNAQIISLPSGSRKQEIWQNGIGSVRDKEN